MKKFLFILMGLIIAGNALGIESKKIIQGAQNVGSTIGSGVGTAVGTVAGAGVVAAGVAAKGAGYVAVGATAPLWAPVAGVEKAIDDYVGTGCGINAVSYTRTAAQGPKDNEFLYSVEAWEDINRGMNLFSDRAYKDLRGKVWECDNQYCSDNTKQLMPAGHVFKGQTINKQKCYKCIAKAGFNDDRWEEVALSECGVANKSDDKGACETPWGKIAVGQSLKQKHTKQDCMNNNITITDNNGTEFEVVCRDGGKAVCKPSQCPKGYTVDVKNGKCVPDKSRNEGGNPVSNCKDSRSTAEGKACCDVDSSVATWNGTKCMCKNGGEFVYQGIKTPYCKGNGGGSTPVVEPEINPDQEACKKKADVADWINGKCVCKQSGYEWQDGDCQKSAATIAAENAEIDTVYADIQNLESKYATKISKWKDAEGNFNTARLASDSIAGVVLGTVGGVVTSTIIKKNQVEDGFEDLKCSIGGQSVATWGDEFQVGLQ